MQDHVEVGSRKALLTFADGGNMAPQHMKRVKILSEKTAIFQYRALTFYCRIIYDRTV